MARLSRPTLDLLTRRATQPATRPATRPNGLLMQLRVRQAWKPVARALKRHIAERLTMLRRGHGMSQTEMAASCGLTAQQFAKYERGLCRLPPDRMWLIATCFSIDITYFFDDFDPAEMTPQSPMPPAPPRDYNAASRLKIAAALAGITSARKLHSLTGLIQAMADEPTGT